MYKKRVIDSQIKQLLESFGAILIASPKWCGKTNTAEYQAKSVFYVENPEGNFQLENWFECIQVNAKPKHICKKFLKNMKKI